MKSWFSNSHLSDYGDKRKEENMAAVFRLKAQYPNTCVVILYHLEAANIAMKFAIKYPDKVQALILNGGNLNPKGVKRTTQIPIEIGYKIAKRFASKSHEAKKNAEMLGLMVNDPNIEGNELSKITVPTLVICLGNFSLIYFV